MPTFARSVRVRAVIPHDGKFLFVQHKFNPTFWALAGGGLEDGETLQQGIERELIEELGVKPMLGRLLYVQQLFSGAEGESMEFFFEVMNGVDYQQIDLQSTSHGAIELSRVDFIDPSQEYILPEFLSSLRVDLAADKWPKVYVRSAEKSS